MSERILVIDDDSLVRLLITTALESVGYEVTTSGDGADGIRLYSEKAFDLVITDIMMPGINGVQVVQKLKQKDPAVRIITISSGSAEEKSDLLRMSVILGAVKALHKPIDSDKLLETEGCPERPLKRRVIGGVVSRNCGSPDALAVSLPRNSRQATA